MTLELRRLGRETVDAFEALLTPSHGCDGCWCFNHHNPRGVPEVSGNAARLAFRSLAEHGLVHGVLAFDGTTPVGWCAFDPRRVLSGHDCTMPCEADGTVWSVHCFYVAPSHRARGVARVMLWKALEWIREAGGAVVEAYPSPRNAGGAALDFCGSYSMFEAVGFREVERISPHYVRMVLSLEGRAHRA